MIVRTLCTLSLCLILVSCPGEEGSTSPENGAPPVDQASSEDRSELRWIPEPGTIEGFEKKYAGKSHEEMRFAFDEIEESLNIEKKSELERLHDEGHIVAADKDPTGKPVWPSSIPRDCFFQSRTRQVKGRPASEMKAWFVYLPFEDYPHLYEMREELRWLKKALYPDGKFVPPPQKGG